MSCLTEDCVTNEYELVVKWHDCNEDRESVCPTPLLGPFYTKHSELLTSNLESFEITSDAKKRPRRDPGARRTRWCKNQPGRRRKGDTGDGGERRRKSSRGADSRGWGAAPTGSKVAFLTRSAPLCCHDGQCRVLCGHGHETRRA